MGELIFDVTSDEDDRYVAVARGNGIATDGADWAKPRVNAQELIAACYSDYSDATKPKKCHLLLNQVLAVA